MLSTLYTVTIAALSGSGDADGFIDNMKVEQYMANGSVPSSFTVSENKVRGNIRFKNVVENLQSMGNMYVSNAVATGATANTIGSNFTFNLEIERGDQTLVTNDEQNAGQQLFGANAIIRCVASGMMETRNSYVYPVYDPTQTTAPSNGTQTSQFARVGSTTVTFNVAQLASSISTATAAVTVSKLA